MKDQALDFFMQMGDSQGVSNSHTIISILAACKDESFLKLNRSIYGYAIKLGIIIDPSLHTTLTEMYLNYNDELIANNLFKSFKEKDLIS